MDRDALGCRGVAGGRRSDPGRDRGTARQRNAERGGGAPVGPGGARRLPWRDHCSGARALRRRRAGAGSDGGRTGSRRGYRERSGRGRQHGRGWIMKNLGQLMKQAQQMQQKMAEMQAELETVEMTGIAGGGMVQLTLNGKGDMKRLKIDKGVADPAETEVLEDLIVAAFNDARAKVNAHAETEMQKLTGGLALPGGMKLPF